MEALYIETLSDEFFTLPHEPTHHSLAVPKKNISQLTTKQHNNTIELTVGSLES